MLQTTRISRLCMLRASDSPSIIAGLCIPSDGFRGGQRTARADHNRPRGLSYSGSTGTSPRRPQSRPSAGITVGNISWGGTDASHCLWSRQTVAASRPQTDGRGGQADTIAVSWSTPAGSDSSPARDCRRRAAARRRSAEYWSGASKRPNSGLHPGYDTI